MNIVIMGSRRKILIVDYWPLAREAIRNVMESVIRTFNKIPDIPVWGYFYQSMVPNLYQSVVITGRAHKAVLYRTED